jgi:hypothetical protein
MSTVTAISFKPKATRKSLKKEILSDDFKKRKIIWKNIAENFPYGTIFYLTTLGTRERGGPRNSWRRTTLNESGNHSWSDLRFIARNREGWRRFVDNLCS